MTKAMINMRFFGDGKKNPTNWKRGNSLGSGKFGNVYRATRKTTEGIIELAVKEIKICEVYKQKSQEEIVNREIATLKQVSHERIIKFYGVCSTDSKFHIFIEYSPLGSLSKFIYDKKVIDEIKARLFSKQLLEGVAYLHGIGIFHRDIKCDNVLVFDEDNIKLADFGLAKVFAEITQTYTNGIGTIRFMAPEMIKNQKYNKKVDIWSVGCVAVNMLTGKVPFHELEEQQVVYCVGHENRSPVTNILPQLPDCSNAFFEKTFQVDPKQRPSAESLLTDRFITGIYYSKGDDFLLIGCSGIGKSATGNSILRESCFETNRGTTFIESSWVYKSRKVNGVRIGVIDGPGIDTNSLNDDIMKSATESFKKALQICDYNFTALLIVLKYGSRFTEQEILTIKLLKGLLGEHIIADSGICVFTHGDAFEDDQRGQDSPICFDDWCKEQEGEIKKLFEECKYRCMLFNNKTQDEKKRRFQVEKLFVLKDQLPKTFSRDDFETSKGERHIFEQKNLNIEIKKEIEQKLSEIREKLRRLELKSNCGAKEKLIGLQTLEGELDQFLADTPSSNKNLRSLVLALVLEMQSKKRLIEFDMQDGSADSSSVKDNTESVHSVSFAQKKKNKFLSKFQKLKKGVLKNK